eukprot:scaffold148511_cov31-Prasinocladus_malaysianus.AAC.1
MPAERFRSVAALQAESDDGDDEDEHVAKPPEDQEFVSIEELALEVEKFCSVAARMQSRKGLH